MQYFRDYTCSIVRLIAADPPEVLILPVDAKNKSTRVDLSDRQHMIALRFAQGLTYRQIAEELFIAPTTVRTHLSAIYRRLGVRTKAALAMRLAQQAGDSLAANEHALPQRSGPPIIAVIPFENLCTDERWSRAADALSADIMTDLARYRDLSVIAHQTILSWVQLHHDVKSIGRELNADYVIGGTLQAEDGDVRVSVQLIDATTGVALWAARYERTADELFEMQDGVVESVINVLAACHGELFNLRRNDVRRKQPDNLQAYDYYLLGVEAQDTFTRDSNVEAIRLHTRAVDLDPGFARAWAALGLAYAVNACNGFSEAPAIAFDQAKTCLKRSLMLDPGDSVARICLADLNAPQIGLKRSAEEHSAALAIAPHDADTIAMFAGSQTLISGDPHLGYEFALRAVRLNPLIGWYHGMLGRSAFVLGMYDECLSAFQRTTADAPTTLFFLAMAHAMLDEEAEAREIARRLQTHFNGFTARGFIDFYPVTNPPAIAAIRQGASRAGLI